LSSITAISAPIGPAGSFTFAAAVTNYAHNRRFLDTVMNNGVIVTNAKVNSAPVLAVIGDKSVDEGSTLSFTVTATDSDLPVQALTFALSGAPAEASIQQRRFQLSASRKARSVHRSTPRLEISSGHLHLPLAPAQRPTKSPSKSPIPERLPSRMLKRSMWWS
jgi:hypothetical protein